jgi:hypothetical protein
MPIPKAAPRRVQRQRAAGPAFTITAICLGALLIVAAIVYEGVFATRPGKNRPALVSSPQTDAVQIWKDETATLSQMRVSRMMADNRNDFADVHRWDAAILAQEAKVDSARRRKELPDR